MQSIGEIFGFIGGALGVIQALPQALRIRKLGTGYGVSHTSWYLMLLVMASWFSYGIMLNSPSLIISNAIGFTTSALVVASLVNRGFWVWPAMYAGAALWVLLVTHVPMAVVTGFLIVLTMHRVPQVLRSIANLRAGLPTAVSIRALSLSLAAAASWEVYSLMSGHTQLVLTTSVALTLTLAIFTLEVFTHRLTQKEVTA